MSHFGKEVVGSEINGTWFGFYTQEEIARISVKEITNPISVDELGAHLRGGLYDPALGPQNQFDICETCGLTADNCPGHPGHISLALPVYHPILYQIFYKLLRCVCFNCHHLRVPRGMIDTFIKRMTLLSTGKLFEAINYNSSHEMSFVTTTLLKGLAKQGEVEEQIKAAFRDKQKSLRSNSAQKQKKKRPLNNIEGLVNQSTLNTNVAVERKKLVTNFFKDMNPRKCASCNAYNPPLRKDDLKIFQVLSQGPMRENKNLGIDVVNLKGADIDYVQYLQEVARKEAAKANKSDPADLPDPNTPSHTATTTTATTTTTTVNVSKEGGNVMVSTPNRTKGKIGAAGSSVTDRAEQDANKARYIPTSEAKQRITRFFINEHKAMECLFKAVFPSLPGVVKRRIDPSMFFCDVLLIPPSRFRPAAKGAAGDMEHPQNVYFKQVLNINRRLLDGSRPGSELKQQQVIDLALEMQKSVNCLMDSSKAPADSPAGIKQLLEKKQGLFRKNMMGKRVNFAARSVISPDPYLQSNQIGVPEVFAKKLTFAQPVTDWNYKELAQMVINGPDVHPGANMIEDEYGRVTILKGGEQNKAARVALSKTLLAHNATNSQHLPNKKVYRHLIDNDVVIMNRQPTLHKPSMMTHRTLVQKNERVIRMHYANCKTFNADFDGDEMNMHFPQSQQARADGLEIMFSDKQYITATNGTPLRGLIQDHVVSGVLLTKRDTFFTRAQFQQLLFSAVVRVDRAHMVTPPPAILKPQPLWTGKQVISAVLQHIISTSSLNDLYKQQQGGHAPSHSPIMLNLDAKAQVGKEMWANDVFESIVTIRNGELLTGVLDKAQFGAATYGLVHCCYELYGETIAGVVLSTLGRLFTIYLQFYGFTCGIDDLIVQQAGNRVRQNLLLKADMESLLVATEFSNYRQSAHKSVTDALRDTLLNDDDFERLDTLAKTKVNQLTTEIISAIIPSQQMKRFPQNFMALMTLSGAKGSQVNVSQISCLLGQQELEGRRVPVMITGKTLPCFPPYDTRARAGGYIGDRFLTGIRPQEYYFHCMAGREGLVDTAVKTSNSGYLQRCLIKHLEGLVVAYDYSVRDSDGSLVQMNYGDDCIDPLATKFLHKFDFLAANLDTVRIKYDLPNAKANHAYQIKPVTHYHRKRKQLMDDYERKLALQQTLPLAHPDRHIVIPPPVVDPLLSMFNPATHLGCVSESFQQQLDSFLTQDPLKIFTSPSDHSEFNEQGLKKVDKEEFRELMMVKYRKCLVHPGEAVGVVVGQSIGEPSTQMTLNTFHLAGHGGANVTLGIPRLREIIMTGSETITTPSMTLKLVKGTTSEQAYDLANRFYRLTLPELLKEITVAEVLESASDAALPGSMQAIGMRHRTYTISLHFQPDEFLEREHALTFADFADPLANSFIPVLHAAVVKEIKSHCSGFESVSGGASAQGGLLSIKRKPANKTLNEDDEAEPDTTASDQPDAIEDLQRRKKKQQTSYEDSDEELEVQEELQEEIDANDDDDVDEDDHDPFESDPSVTGTTAAAKKKGASSTSTTTAAAAAKTKKTVKVKKSATVSRTLLNLRLLKSYKCHHSDSRIEFVFQIPVSDKKLLMVSLVERVADAYVVSAIPGIKQCYVESKDNEFSIVTMGSNIKEMWKYSDEIDISQIYCNDVFAVCQTYGIEAGRACIIQEINNVFGAYGIKVDPRHLSLIGDYMTFTGQYKACNRSHMDSKASAWTKMSFETTMKFLSEAALAGGYDPIESPSSRIVVGSVVKGGSGFFDVRQPLL